ncbi:Na(+)/H(+) antiporter subunit C [Novipirellula aureliae]|uniref:Na(+)/H(+) antiporter subunit C n=1 Tax=Novipirellula aureliae TaxID=2527966 RepID=A0A5C6DLV7_9BACT|nr:cation:proton antiporter subunit C [Novipirellula aureliae]TWU37810.1 Na(+)/H(+) antiporter subunit C [Novipirellula aureliae]
MNLEQIFGLYNYWIVICLMMTGFYIVIASQNMVKVVLGLNIFQTSVILMYVTMGKVEGGTAPIVPPAIANGHAAEAATGHAAAEAIIYSNPLPSVLMLTAIVVGIATTSLALALIVRIREEYGTIDESEVLEMDLQS